MAGYIMTLDSIESLIRCVKSGTYSTILSKPKSKWNKQQEGTYADYFSMKSGDNIYFFIKRKIYGIGKLVDLNNNCKYLNYVGADEPLDYTLDEYNNRHPLLPYGTAKNRCLCIFIPTPYFFENGIDMDDALNSNPDKFKMLRAMWKVSFIKVDDEENKALSDIILKRNEDSLFNGRNIFIFNNNIHTEIANKVTSKHKLNANNILASCANNKKIKHEMAIEAVLCEKLISNNTTTFGKWDYISHQVVASPFKAIDYMDKMDVFGYRYINNYKTISKYLVIEIKKDKAELGVINQIMKYVDWIQQEYAYGDYSMIEAYVVASDFSEEVIEKRNNECVRNFTKGYRPAISCTWNFVKLIKYEYINGDILFHEIK